MRVARHVLDYGEHGTWHDDQLEISPTEDRAWPVRPDTFSTNRAGFEIRTRRLCRRVLMFHHFAAELGEDPYLVASTDLIHAEDPALTRVTGVIQRSYELDALSGYYATAALPTLEFEYSDASIDPVLHEITDKATLKNLPGGIDGRMSRLGDGRFGAMIALPSRSTTLGAPGVAPHSSASACPPLA